MDAKRRAFLFPCRGSVPQRATERLEVQEPSLSCVVILLPQRLGALCDGTMSRNTYCVVTPAELPPVSETLGRKFGYPSKASTLKVLCHPTTQLSMNMATGARVLGAVWPCTLCDEILAFVVVRVYTTQVSRDT